MEAIRSSELSEKFYSFTQCHISEGSILPFLLIFKTFKRLYSNLRTPKTFKNNILKPAFLIRIRYCINRQRQDQKCVCSNIRSKRVNRWRRSIKHTSKLCRQKYFQRVCAPQGLYFRTRICINMAPICRFLYTE
jgi:hypothetical protein